jgi:hypothetical protein
MPLTRRLKLLFDLSSLGLAALSPLGGGLQEYEHNATRRPEYSGRTQ